MLHKGTVLKNTVSYNIYERTGYARKSYKHS